jgi:hypothetical protein
MKPARRRIDVNLDELDWVQEGARQAPLSEADHDKLKGALHALAAMLVQPRNNGEDQGHAGTVGRLVNWSRDSAGDERSPATRTRTQWRNSLFRAALHRASGVDRLTLSPQLIGFLGRRCSVPAGRSTD